MRKTEDENNGDRLNIRLFGTFEVSVCGSPMPKLRTRKGLWLLALLCLKHGSELNREWIAEALWPDSDLERSAANLRLSLHDLRRALGPEAHRVQSPTPRTLRLNVEGCAIDLLEFDAYIARGDAESLKTAASLYRGRLLEECPESWAETDRAQREQACIEALGTLASWALDQDDPAGAESFLRRTLQLDPLRESACRGLMQAQAVRGDVAAAIQVYRDLRVLLRNELNIEPSPETVEAYRALTETAGGSRTRKSDPHKPDNPRNAFRMPRPLTEFVGRQPEVHRVALLVPKNRLVTLTGPGGIGKTRLAIEIAQGLNSSFPDGIFFADLAPITDENVVASAIANVVSAPIDKRNEMDDDLFESLSGRTSLIVLDSCEHVVAACAEVIGALLQSAPNLHVLATSRQALGITGEIDWRVQPLSLAAEDGRANEIAGAESVQLFVQRAQSVRPDFALSDSNARAVAHVCGRLDGIPLALELAAARLKILSIEQVAERLDDRFALLSSGSSTALPRHRTLEATLDWSFALLSEPERLLLLRLSVFPGRFNLEAADVVCGGSDVESLILDLLAQLADKSLVSVEEDGGEALYRLLESTRAYARARFNSESDLAGLRGRHAEYFLAFAERAQPMLGAPQAAIWLDRLELRNDDFRHALAWYSDSGTSAEREAGLRLATALWPFWNTRHYVGDVNMRSSNNVWSEAVIWLENLLTGVPPVCAATATAQQHLGTLAVRCDSTDRAKELFARSLETWEALDDRVGAASTLRAMSAMYVDNDEHLLARELLQRSLELCKDARDVMAIAWSMSAIGTHAILIGDIATGRTMAEGALSIQREVGHPLGISAALTNAGVAALAAGDWSAARAANEESLAINEALRHTVGVAWCYDNLAEVALAEADLDRACELYVSAAKLFHSLWHRTGMADCMVGAAEISLIRNQPDVAMRFLTGASMLRHRHSRISQADRRRFERLTAEARARIAPDAGDAFNVVGKRMSMDEALSFVLHELDS